MNTIDQLDHMIDQAATGYVRWHLLRAHPPVTAPAAAGATEPDETVCGVELDATSRRSPHSASQGIRTIPADIEDGRHNAMDPDLFGWHFLRTDRRVYGNGTLPPERRTLVEVGQTLTATDAPLALCSYGLHWSRRALDALGLAPGPIVEYVSVGGTILEHDDSPDKGCSTERTCLWMADATDVLRAFARWCALEVLPLWPNAPAVVRRYLDTGDEALRNAAWRAASAAAGASRRDGATRSTAAAAWAADAAAYGAWAAADADAYATRATAAAYAAADAAAWAAADAATDWTARDAAVARFNAELERRLWTLAPAEMQTKRAARKEEP